MLKELFQKPIPVAERKPLDLSDEDRNNIFGFDGNKNLKKCGVSYPMNEFMLREYKKCKEDPIYFAKTYVKITDADGEVLLMNPFEHQIEIIQKFYANRELAVLTSRQAGKTTTAALLILHYIIFNQNKRVGILAQGKDGAVEVVDRIKAAYEQLPYWLSQGVKKWNELNIDLENGCRIKAGPTNSPTMRGKTFQFLYVDETAIIENWDEFKRRVLPTASGKKTKILYTSTPNGLNHFYKIVEDSRNGQNDFALVEVPWNRVPGRDEEWKRRTIRNDCSGDLEMFEQEYNLEFMGSSNTLIRGQKLKELAVGKHLNVVEKEMADFGMGLRIYAKYKKGNTYVMTVDTADGDGGDFSAISVFDVTEMPYKQVATYRHNEVSPAELSQIVSTLGKRYDEAYCVVESNNRGKQVVDILHYEYEYPMIASSRHDSKEGRIVLSGGGYVNSKRGVMMTKSVKSTGCSNVKMLIEQDQLLIRDEQTIEELKTFSKKANSYEAEGGNNDDLVMTMVMFGWVSTQKYFQNFSDSETLLKLRERSEEEILENMIPVGFIPNAEIEDDGWERVE